MNFRILLDPQGGEGNGTGGGAPTTTPETPADAKGADLVKGVEGLISRHGDPTAALRVLMGENYDLRDKNREILKRLPSEGSIVLTGDDAKRWGTYRELGEPAEIRRGLGERDQYKAESDGFRKAEVVRSAAEASGYDASVLSTLAKDLEIVMDTLKDERGNLIGKDGKLLAKDSKGVPAAFVKGEGEAMVSLETYAVEHWAKFMPSLKAEAEKSRPIGSPTIARQSPPGSGTNPQDVPRLPVRNVF